MNSTKHLIAAALLVLATACAAPAAPKTFADRVADVLQTTDEVVTTTRTLLRLEKISPAAALKVAATAKTVKDGADMALSLSAQPCGPTPPLPTCADVSTAATARLRLAAAALQALEASIAQGAK
jgi:hypothetical protein